MNLDVWPLERAECTPIVLRHPVCAAGSRRPQDTDTGGAWAEDGAGRKKPGAEQGGAGRGGGGAASAEPGGQSALGNKVTGEDGTNAGAKMDGARASSPEEGAS